MPFIIFEEKETQMNRLIKIVVLLVMVLSFSSLRAERVLFTHYTIEDGLSSNSVNSVCQDSHGFMWFATLYGVSRFDGVNFKNFTTATDSAVLRNDVYYSFMLPNGKPTFTSSNGVIFSYDEQKHAFTDISAFLPEDKKKYDLKGFSVQADGAGLLSTACGIYKYNKANDNFDKISTKGFYAILDVCTDVYGRYWIGHFGGVQIFDKQGKPLYENSSALKDLLIGEIFRLDDKHMLVCSPVGDIWLAELTGETSLPKFTKVDAPFKYVSAMTADKAGNLWMGTLDNGLWKCRFDGAKFQYDKIVPLNEPEGSLTKISSLYADAEDNIWVSTISSGVWRTTSVDKYAYIKSKDVGVPLSVGSAFCETSNGEVLMGTDGMGMYLIDTMFQVKRTFHGLSANSVLSIIKDDDDYMLGYWGGETSRFNLATGHLSNVHYNGIQKPIFTTKNVLKTTNGAYYVSATGDGIYYGVNNSWERLALADTSMNNYPDLWFEGSYQKPDGSVRLVSARTVWSNLSGRFRAIMPDADKSMQTNPLHPSHCVANADNELFVATNKGIYAFSRTDSAYGRLDYLPMGEYASVLVDGNGILWSSGSNGILAIDTKHKTYECVMPASSMPSADYFTGRACVLTSSGKMFFGCKDGFVCVQPSVQQQHAASYLAFSQLSIHGEPVLCGSELLPQPLSETKGLSLAYSQTHLSIGFELVDFSLVNKLEAKYRIPELDNAWVDLGKNRNIDITYLPAGTFTVELAAFSGNKVVQVVELPIYVSEPWWKSLWFTALVLLLIAAAFYAIYRVRMRRMVENKRELERMVNERTRDLNDANKLLETRQTEIEAKNESLLATLKQKDQLVSVVAHDLKNPMFAIVSTLKRMVSQVYAPADQQRLLVQLSNESEGLQKQMINLLQWASEDEGMLACHLSATNANVLVKEALALLDGLAGEKDIELRLEGNTAYSTWTDARMFSTIVRNLVTNAVKFSPKGSLVKVCLSENGDKTMVEVVDEGVGMSQEKIAELLSGENVTSTTGTEKEEGFGFGFRIVLDYLHKINGTINISSQSGKGTSMVIALPMCREEKLDEAPAVSEKMTVDVPINKDLLAGKTIMVVDDDNLLLEHISSLLSPYVEVVQAHDGEQGFALAHERIPDLIVSDVDMPNMNGIEMYEKLMADAMTSNIPLLFLSAKTDNSVRLKGLSIGAIDYIAKPFADEELLVKICNFLLWQQKEQQKVLTQSLESTEPVVEETMNPLLEKIINLVKQNYTNPLYSLTDIVQELGMSKATLSRRLKSITDKTPMEILTEYRLNLAKKLLSDGNMSVSDVAYAVGFNDPSYFSRRFKEIFGSSPKSAR